MTRSAGDRQAPSGPTRAQLLVVLPLTMALLVAGTGFFTLSMAERFYVLHRPGDAALRTFTAQLGVQVALIAVVSAIIGLSIAIGITRPVRQMAQQLGAIASGDLRSGVEIRSISELDSLAGAFNTAVDAVNRYLLHGLTGAVLTIDTDGTVIGASPSAEGILGSREGDLVGRRLSDVLNPAPGSHAALAAVENSVKQRRPVAVEDVEIVGQDGQAIRIGLTASYLRRADRDGDHEVVGVLITFKDVGEIRRLRDRLRQADHLVALGTVTAGVAHELRNPLASVRGLAELLGRDFASDDPRQRYVSTMLDAIDRLNRLIEDLLLFSSPAPAFTEEIDLGPLVREVALFVRHGLDPRQLRIAVEAPPRRVSVLASSDRLSHALTNIVANAVQATPEGGTVSLRVEATEREAIVRIHNTGSYITPDVRAQLFVPFFTTKASGTGLGLAIARQFVTMAGGRIDVDSDRTEGTTFSMALPLGPGTREPRAADVPQRLHMQSTRA